MKYEEDYTQDDFADNAGEAILRFRRAYENYLEAEQASCDARKELLEAKKAVDLFLGASFDVRGDFTRYGF